MTPETTPENAASAAGTDAAPAAPAVGAPELTVFPLRFTADPRAMIAFLVELGMARRITAGDDGFGELRAGAGAVMVHAASTSATGARAGTTDLCMATPSADRAAEALEREGIEVTVWDESYGRQGMITGPDGEGVSLNEDQVDLYGYEGHDASPDPRLHVRAVLSSEDFGRDARWLGRLGFAPAAAGGPGGADGADGVDGEKAIASAERSGWLELHGPGSAGIIGLHAPMAGRERTRRASPEMPDLPPTLQVRLGLETSEDLEALTARLRSAGHDARLVEGAVRAVHVPDPDGIEVEIHPLP
ncbi:hypothetical protein I8D64_04335 [Brachybacterium sp. MASK1Z-5]|uniref:VOC domain-containing protein n=1 Tax=Brachybacterium halotolerans TaxID=2795215 RepID=A0ABS1B9J0_9MICO|nr:hypothetical protein [Brachybacterium halotolerans]MBK0330625.1 hypothetical protein [Brachybacterium halotolerans]